MRQGASDGQVAGVGVAAHQGNWPGKGVDRIEIDPARSPRLGRKSDIKSERAGVADVGDARVEGDRLTVTNGSLTGENRKCLCTGRGGGERAGEQVIGVIILESKVDRAPTASKNEVAGESVISLRARLELERCAAGDHHHTRSYGPCCRIGGDRDRTGDGGGGGGTRAARQKYRTRRQTDSNPLNNCANVHHFHVFLL